MSDKEIIKVLKKIQLHCARGYCKECAFEMNNERCQIMHLAGLLAELPSRWKIEKIEEVICK